MPKASDLKRGMVVEVNDEPYSVKEIEVRNPSSRGASTLYKVRFNHLKTKQKRDETLKGDVSPIVVITTVASAPVIHIHSCQPDC